MEPKTDKDVVMEIRPLIPETTVSPKSKSKIVVDADSSDVKYSKNSYGETVAMLNMSINFVLAVSGLVALFVAGYLVTVLSTKHYDFKKNRPHLIAVICLECILTISFTLLCCVKGKSEAKVVVHTFVTWVNGTLCGFVLFIIFNDLMDVIIV